ncbi:MAG TPA: RNA polymerase sigma factor [Pirellulales bacterium]|nr:RNA polymerase sigma factor [Pirellulales bacterium]
MTESPETHASLILRLHDRADQQAWREFVEIHQPVIYRLARYKGLQHADADDVVQQVLSAVAGAVERWQPDENRGRFRTWLQTIARNRIANALSRQAADRASGESGERELLARQPAAEADSRLLVTECRREIFQWAARQIRDEFETDTWDAFWQTAVQGRKVSDVARLLGKTAGAIYTARSHVMRRLKQKVLEWEAAE